MAIPRWGSLMLTFLSITLAATRGAEAQATNCNAVLTSLAPCLRFLQNRAESPSIRCCDRFAMVVERSPQCLCGVANGDPLPLGITVNHTQSLALPPSCNVTTPPLSACNDETSPLSAAPSPSPSSAIPEDPTPLSPEPTASAEVNPKSPTAKRAKLPESPSTEAPGPASKSSRISGLVSSTAASAAAALGLFLL